MEVVLKMSFLAFSNVVIEFIELRKRTWRFYTIAKALPTTNKINLIDKGEFTKTAMDKNSKMFVIYVSALEVNENAIHLSHVAQIAVL